MRSVRRGQPDQSLALLEGSQFPTRTPIRSTPFTRRIPAAKFRTEQAGVRSLESNPPDRRPW